LCFRGGRQRGEGDGGDEKAFDEILHSVTPDYCSTC
jgi:hypothetical protein